MDKKRGVEIRKRLWREPHEKLRHDIHPWLETGSSVGRSILRVLQEILS